MPRSFETGASFCNENGPGRGCTVELERKLQFRDRAIRDFADGFLRKEARYKKLWEARLSMQMVELPEYGDIFRLVRREFRRAGLL